jgi:hypothetical protein
MGEADGAARKPPRQARWISATPVAEDAGLPTTA